MDNSLLFPSHQHWLKNWHKCLTRILLSNSSYLLHLRMGLVFSPGLIMLNILKLVIIMYVRSWAIMVTNVPPKRIFKASHQFYLLLLLVMLFLCLLAVGYAVVE